MEFSSEFVALEIIDQVSDKDKSRYFWIRMFNLNNTVRNLFNLLTSSKYEELVFEANWKYLLAINEILI
jgi:hypothetical protein